MFGPDSSGIQPFRGFFFFSAAASGSQDHSKAIPSGTCFETQKPSGTCFETQNYAHASKLKTHLSGANTQAEAWFCRMGHRAGPSARRRASLGPTPPLQKPAFRPNLPLPFLLTLSGHNSPPDVAREEHPWRLPRIAVMPRRHGDTRFDGMIRSVDTGQIVSK